MNISLIVFIGIIIVLILVTRLFGAWMLRINDVIFYQKKILEELKNINNTDKLE